MIYIKRFVFYERINYQFKTSGLKNVKAPVEQTVKHLSSVSMDWKCAFMYKSVTYIPSSLSLKMTICACDHIYMYFARYKY